MTNITVFTAKMNRWMPNGWHCIVNNLPALSAFMPMINGPLHIVFATAEPAGCLQLISSIENHLAGMQLTFAAVLFGDKSNDKTLPAKVNIIHATKTFLPIYQTRNLCQQYLQQLMFNHGGIGLVLDDDLQWIMAKDQFAALCHTLTNKGCDMAFVQLAGDPPIPKEYTRASPLLDVLLAIYRNGTLKLPNAAQTWLEKVEKARNKSAQNHQHHDYYTYNPAGFVAIEIALESWDHPSFIERLAIGQSTTRPVMQRTECVKANGRERGGATLIFNHAMLDFQNLAITLGNYCSRRSDMMMARQAFFSGACLYSVPAVLKHNRVTGFDAIHPPKLIGDMLGYSLVEAFEGEPVSHKAIIDQLGGRLGKTQQIIADTSMMLDWLHTALRSGHFIGEQQTTLINQMIEQNRTTLVHLDGFSSNIGADKCGKKIRQTVSVISFPILYANTHWASNQTWP